MWRKLPFRWLKKDRLQQCAGGAGCAHAALATGLLSKMIPALIDGLGGEQAFAEAAAPAATAAATEGDALW